MDSLSLYWGICNQFREIRRVTWLLKLFELTVFFDSFRRTLAAGCKMSSGMLLVVGLLDPHTVKPGNRFADMASFCPQNPVRLMEGVIVSRNLLLEA